MYQSGRSLELHLATTGQLVGRIHLWPGPS